MLRMNLLLLQEQAEDLTPRQREILEAAVLGGEELAGTIDELLNLTRIEAGQLRILREPVEVGVVIEQVMRALRPRFEDAEVALRVVKGVPAVIRGDAARLRIVFINLLVTALEYTARGGEVSVRLTTMQDAAEGGRRLLQIAVTDTGSGIPAEFRERVFEKFFRVEHHGEAGAEGVRGAGAAAAEAGRLVAGASCAGLILSVGLAHADAVGLVRRWRDRGVGTPILLLVRPEEAELGARGLDAGADDYLVKPASVVELLAGLRARLRRARSEGSGVLQPATMMRPVEVVT
jgi:DNA-binding NarL/FixJ family response regulator